MIVIVPIPPEPQGNTTRKHNQETMLDKTMDFNDLNIW